MILDHPIRFKPIFRSYIWGGQRLAKSLGKAVPEGGSGAAADSWAESWEIVDHGSDQTQVADGPWEGWTLRQLIESFPDAVLGKSRPDDRFPLLLKYLDCNRVLSVQVHPDDFYGSKMPIPDLGKTEAWYVLQAEPGSKIYAGLKDGIDRESLKKLIDLGRSEEALHLLYPKAGDCVFIPAGTVHALGEGLLVAEIQQASDTTFRLYDWDRVDQNGKGRPLHIEQALEVIDFDSGPVEFAKPITISDGMERLVACDKFILDRVFAPKSYAFPNDDRFRIVTVVKGSARLAWDESTIPLSLGQSALIPALHCKIELCPATDSSVLVASTSERPS